MLNGVRLAGVPVRGLRNPRPALVAYAALLAAALVGVVLHGAPEAFGFGAALAGLLTLSLYAPLFTAVALLVLRPVAESYDVTVPSGSGGGLTLQGFWGIGLAVCLVVLARRWGVQRSRLAMGALGAVAACGVLGALAGPVTRSAMREWFWVVLGLSVFVVAREAARRFSLERLAVVFASAGLVLVLVIVTDPYRSWGSLETDAGTVAGLNGGYHTTHTLAFAALSIIPWALVLAFSARDPRLKAGAIVLAGLLEVMITLTTSRAGQVGSILLFASVIPAFAVLRGWRLRGQWKAKALLTAGVSLGVVVAVAVPSVRTRWISAFDTGGKGLSWLGSGRGFLWHQAWLDFLGLSPVQKVVGTGLGASSLLTEQRISQRFAAHSDLLELLVSVGVLGLLVFAALVVLFVRRLLRARPVLREAGKGWLWVLGAGAFVAFIAPALLVGLLAYTSGAVWAFAFLGAVVGVGSPAAATVTDAPPARARVWVVQRARPATAAAALAIAFAVTILAASWFVFYTWG